MEIDIPKIFEGKRVSIIGGGSSLIGFDFNRVVQPIVSINNSIEYVESVLHVSLDGSWYKNHRRAWEKYDGYIVTDREVPCDRAIRVKLNLETLLDHCIGSCNLSGFLALAVAFHLGAAKVYLFGYDGGFAAGLPSNYYTNNDQISSRSIEKKNMWYNYFEKYPVVNVGENSFINTFKKVPLDSRFYDY